MKLINKANVEAELKRRIQESLDAGGATRGVYLSERMKEDSYILSFLDTLEVKEADLEEEISKELSRVWYGEYLDLEKFEKSAKHFFELGLKTKQNINIDVTNIDKVIEENGADPNSKEAKMFKESYYTALEKLKAKKGE